MEAPEELSKLARWWKLKKLSKPVGWGVPITFLGLVLVIGGIVGEGIFEYRSSDAETSIRAHDEGVLQDTTVQAGDAKDSAKAAKIASGNAIRDAGTAESTANKASTIAAGADARAKVASARAGDAQGKAQTADTLSNTAQDAAADAIRDVKQAKNDLLVVRMELAQDEAALVAEQNTRKEIEEAIAPRPGLPSIGWLSKPDPTLYASALGQFPDRAVTIKYAKEFWTERDAQDLALTLYQAGWKVTGPVESSENLGDKISILFNNNLYTDGSEADRKAIEAAKTLETFLRSCRWNAFSRGSVNYFPNGGADILIFVGAKPRTYPKNQQEKKDQLGYQKSLDEDVNEQLAFWRGRHLDDSCVQNAFWHSTE